MSQYWDLVLNWARPGSQAMQAPDPTADAWVPGWQGSHCEDPRGANFPTGHARQVPAAPPLPPFPPIKPAGQSSHARLLVESEVNLPTAHTAQAVAPAVGACLPVAHTSQVSIATRQPKVPEGQALQVPAGPGLAVPSGQG